MVALRKLDCIVLQVIEPRKARRLYPLHDFEERDFC